MSDCLSFNQAVKRNANRFPSEFMFALTDDETEELVTNCDRFRSVRHSSVAMRAFSEHGVIMVASIVPSRRWMRCSFRRSWRGFDMVRIDILAQYASIRKAASERREYGKPPRKAKKGAAK